MRRPSKTRQATPERGVAYWLYRSLLCVIVAPLIGIMVGIVSGVTGFLLGELAALVVLVLFMTDLFIRLVRARRVPALQQIEPAGLWDQEMDG
jgi:hypothetical protein